MAQVTSGHEVIVRAIAAFIGLWGALLLVSQVFPAARVVTSSGQDLPEQALVQVAFAAWCVAAALGLARRSLWGWWLATVMAAYQVLTNLLGAVLSDVVTGDAAGARELFLLGAGLRLLAWLSVGLVLHGHLTTLLFDLPWEREEERRRSGRVFTYAVALLAFLHVLSRYVFPQGL